MWNAARFSNSQYDKLVAQYIAATDVSTQKSIAGQIETLLLAQTPIIFAYFYNYLTATAQGVTGVYPTAIGHLFLNNAAQGLGLRAVRRLAAHRTGRAPSASALAWSATARRGNAVPMATENRARTDAHGHDGGTTTGTCPAAGCARPCSAPWTGW